MGGMHCIVGQVSPHVEDFNCFQNIKDFVAKTCHRKCNKPFSSSDSLWSVLLSDILSVVFIGTNSAACCRPMNKHPTQEVIQTSYHNQPPTYGKLNMLNSDQTVSGTVFNSIAAFGITFDNLGSLHGRIHR